MEIEEKMAREALTSKLVEGLDSGTPIPFNDEFTEQRKQAFLQRMASRTRLVEVTRGTSFPASLD